MTPQETVNNFADLVSRAIKVVGNPPYWKFVSNEEFATLDVDEDEATLSWPDARTDYDCCLIETESVTFPLSLLTIPEEELLAWATAQRTVYDEDQKQKKRMEADARVAHERAMFEQLKAKYE